MQKNKRKALTTAIAVGIVVIVMIIAACSTGVATGAVALGVLKALSPLKSTAAQGGRADDRLAQRHAAAIAAKRS